MTLVTIARAQDVLVISKTEFFYNEVVHKMDQNFILISLRETGSDGKFYYVDKQGTVVWAETISSGAKKFRTPEGIFEVYNKRKRWMSTKYPDESGINNMDYSNFFLRGYALHQGSINHMSHGCIHISKKYSKILFDNSPIGTPVIVTRDNYISLLSDKEKVYLFK